METRRYTKLRAFNRLGMSEFWLDRIEYDKSGPFQNVVFVAGKGYMGHFGAEIKFIEMEYIASARFFVYSTLHKVPLEELPIAQESPGCTIYCFEEHFDSDREAVRHYIIARDIEISVHYAGENAEAVFGPSDHIEQEGEDEPMLPARSTEETRGGERKRKKWWQW
jgi:hypothetical protein